MTGTQQHGMLGQREREIMVLSEAGDSIEQIARCLGVKRSYVAQTVRDYSWSHCWAEGDRLDRQTRDASRRHAAAIAATGKNYA